LAITVNIIIGVSPGTISAIAAITESITYRTGGWPDSIITTGATLPFLIREEGNPGGHITVGVSHRGIRGGGSSIFRIESRSHVAVSGSIGGDITVSTHRRIGGTLTYHTVLFTENCIGFGLTPDSSGKRVIEVL
jgi:hypothetical protein